MDKDGSGQIDINDIRGVYTADKHPDVMSGKKTEQQVLQEFLETFETAHNMRHSNVADHIVTRDEWEEYYNNVSASIDNDEYFSLMMNNAWNLDGKIATKPGGWSNQAAGGQSAAASRQGGARGGAAASKTVEAPPMNFTEA
jgi:hypothetical protein